MEKSSIIGLLLGIAAVTVGMTLKGAHLSMLLNPAAIVIIFVGTAASVFMAFPLSDLKKVPTLLKIVFKKQQLPSKRELIEKFVQWGTIARREGLLALEDSAEQISDPFLKNGMKMIIDGNDHEFVRDVLLEDIAMMEERHKAAAQIFSQAGTYAPTLGVLGAVVGLIGALGNIQDIEKIGAAIAAAFVATLMGIFSGYVLWHPIANKLRRLSRQEIEIRQMMVEGLLSFSIGASPIAIEQKLLVFLPPGERYKEEPEKQTEEEENSGETK